MSSRELRSSRDSVLSSLNQKKTALEKSRLRVVTELERIDNSLKQIQAECEKILNDTSPLLNLPTEVTCMIFDLAVASHRKEDHDSKTEHSLPEVVISHVCKRWRDISLNYPRMWTRFFFFANNVESMRNSLNRFDLYVNRSKLQNLELFIDFREDDRERQRAREAEQYELMDMAISVVERWKIVTFFPKLDLHIEVHLGSKLIAASAPNLEYFSYSPDVAYPHFLAKSMESDLLNPAIFKGGAPKLQYLLLDSPIFKMPSLSNIATLRLEVDVNIMPSTYNLWEIFLEILSIPSLTNLSMVGTVFLTPEASGIPTIPMNNLKHLRYSDNEYMTSLLPFLRAPLLETLTIRNDDEGLNEDFEPNPFGLMEEGYFFPSLGTLTLINASPSSPESAWRLMELTKNITSILIFDNISDQDFFTTLTEYAPFNNQCWPNLAAITAHIDSWYQIDVLNDLAHSRPKKSLNLRLSKETYLSCRADFPGPFTRLKRQCILELLGPEEEAETALMRPMWPPGTDCPDYAFLNDPFQLEKMN